MDDHAAPLCFDEQVKLRQPDENYRIPGSGPLLIDEAQVRLLSSHSGQS